MKEFQFNLDKEDGIKDDDLYAVVIYNWDGNDIIDFGLKVYSTIPFFSKQEAEEYRQKFDKKTSTFLKTMVIPID